MGVTALVMAGGRGSRLALSEEKPLLRVGGKPVIERVIAALRGARKVESIVVAVSDYTPRTAELMLELAVSVVRTPGKEYVSDMGYAVKVLGLGSVLAVAADLPLLTGEVVDGIVERFERCGRSALTVVVPLETKKRLGLGGEYAFEFADRRVVPAGINVIDGLKIDEEELDQEICVLDLREVAVNINTVQELRVAESLFGEVSGNSCEKKL
jgi:adenosylcobinamide-phosphate guanylyltransferase